MAALKDAATSFASELADLVSAFAGRDVTFTAEAQGDRVLVEPQGGHVALKIGDVDALCVEIRYKCMLNSTQGHLATETSTVKVHAGAEPASEPLFRYEYDRTTSDHVPSAHLQLHAHRDELGFVMGRAAQSGARRRTKNIATPRLGAAMRDLRFPVGGHRFRPALEDVLDMMRFELGVTPGERWLESSGRHRERYRRRQLAAAVSDCPSEAVAELRRMGYSVHAPADGPRADSPAKLVRY
ncbi:MAG: hypothetical protein Q4G67_15830 [Actinomycetia bacterium]|nr:hypothetical protein [Actinomycetes bacterium]